MLLLVCAWFISPAHAQNKPAVDAVYEFDIPRTSRVQALQELSRQAGGLLLGYLSNDTAEEEALVGPVKGKLTVEDVLRVILRSAMLTFRWVEKDILSVEPIKLKESATVEDELLRWTDASLREEITVVSWALRDLTLSVAPAVVVERERIESIGAPTLAEALRYISQSAYMRSEGSRISGAQYAEMRGLGPDTALILINGRRALPSANSINSSAFDLNTVPITAVEKIEFLLDAGSAPYGTDAIGGIINIVLRKEVPEPTVELRYGASEGGAEQRRFTLSTGFDKNKFHSALIFDYFDLGGLLGSQRPLWRDQDFRRFGGRDQRSPISSPGNISSPTATNLPGLSSPIAAVPMQDPTPGITPEDFLATAGTTDLDSLFNYWSVVPEATRASVVATGSWEINERLTASADMLYVDRDAKFYFAPPMLPGLAVPASNAYNPFGAPVLANRLLTDLGQQHQYVESDLLRAVASLSGRLRGWDWELWTLHSDEDARTWLYNELASGPLMSALESPDPTQALNVFQSGPVGSPELLNGLRAPRHIDQFSSSGTQVAGYVDGTIFSLPAGPLRAMVGGEWREESAVFGSRMGGFDKAREIAAAFAQLRLPLIDGAMELPMVHELSLSFGSRWDDYKNLASGTRSQYGMLWKPHPYVTVRAAESRSFRPPSLYELYLPNIQTIGRISDPARGNEPTNVLISAGGSSELQPVTAKTFTTGIEFNPDTAMNWGLSAEYWRIKMKDRVSLLAPPLLLAHEDRFADRVVRESPTAADLQRGWPGRLRTIDTSRMNVGDVEASGVDVAIRADFQTSAGRFMPELLATWFNHYLSTDLPGQPAMERVNVASEIGSILEWRAILSLGWRRGPFGITTVARYTPSYDDSSRGVRAGREVAAQTLLDLQGTIDFGRWLGASSRLSGFKLAIGATNILDEEPSFAIVGDAAGFDMSQADLKQRAYYIRLEKAFRR